MKKLYFIITILFFTLCCLISIPLTAEDGGEYDGSVKLFTFYYIEKSDAIVKYSIAFLNTQESMVDEDQFKFAAFYISLFDDQPKLKVLFQSNIGRIKQNKQLIEFALKTDASTFLKDEAINPLWNDVYWFMYFASGDTVYLDRLINNIRLNEDRKILNSFLTGASAKWSMGSNIHQHKAVAEYVAGLVQSEPEIYHFLEDVLKLDLDAFWDETISIIKEQREKGLW